MSYRNIIVAVDDEPDANTVCERALSLCQADTIVTLVHIVPPAPPLVSPGVMGSAPPTPALSEEQLQEIVETAEKELSILVDRLRKQSPSESNQKIEQRVVRAPETRAALHEIAQDISADLIIAGSHGRHGLALLFSGSTASDILKDSPCDVLAVRIAE